MGIRGMLRAAVLLLLIRTWLSEGNNTTSPPEFFELPSTMPEAIQNVFNCKNCADETVAHRILNRVLSGYDARLRPYFGGDPVPVGISMYVSNVEHISETSMLSKVTMFLHQTWRDPRLAYCETNLNLTLDHRMAEKLWVPDCYFLNSKETFVHDMSMGTRMFQLHPDGTVHFGMRYCVCAYGSAISAVLNLWVETPLGVERPFHRGRLRPAENTYFPWSQEPTHRSSV